MCTHKIRGTVTEQTFLGCRKLDGTLHFPTAEETLQNYYCHLNSLKPLGRWREPATCIHEPCRAEPDYSSTPKDMNKNVDCSPPCTHTCRPGLAGSLSLSRPASAMIMTGRSRAAVSDRVADANYITIEFTHG
jgi:hypothetical protein